MSRALLLAAISAILLLLANPGVAATCTPSSSPPTAQQGPGTAGSITIYVVVDVCCNAWVYDESNGLTGLQRNDEARDDTCGGRFPSDHLTL